MRDGPTADSASSRQSRKPASGRLHFSLAVLAVVGYVVLAMHGVAARSGTSDEFAHVTAGYAYWTYDDYRLQPENGNWAQRIIALPAVVSRPSFPSLQQEAWRSSNFWLVSEQFFFDSGNDADAMLRRSRMMVAAVGGLAGLLVFAWSTFLFGRPGGWVSLTLFIFSPTMLAHGALTTSDMIATAFFLAATWCLWTVLHTLTPRTIVSSVLATGGLFLAKYSAVIMVPVALSMLAVRMFSSRPLAIRGAGRHASVPRSANRNAILGAIAIVHVLAVPVVIWASYSFRYTAFAAAVTGTEQFIDPWRDVLDSSAVGRTVAWGRKHEILPEAYLFGIATVAAYSRNRSAFLNGEVSQAGGWRWFFPYAALVKSTIPELLLPAIAAIVLLARRRSAGGSPQRDDIRMYDLIAPSLLVAWYWAFSITSTLNIGQRHLMPAMAGTIVLAGAAGLPLTRAWRAMLPLPRS